MVAELVEATVSTIPTTPQTTGLGLLNLLYYM